MERIKNTAGRVERKEARIDPWGRGRVKIVFPRPDASGSLTERIGDISRCEYSPRRRRRRRSSYSSVPAIVAVGGGGGGRIGYGGDDGSSGGGGG